jgi:DNA-directed RNA polymerase beta subunit
VFIVDAAQTKQSIITHLAVFAENACDNHTKHDAQLYILRFMGSIGTPREYLEQPDRALTVLQARHYAQRPFLSKNTLYLGFMVRKTLSIHLGYKAYDNRDSYLNKRIDTPGILSSNLFRQCYGKQAHRENTQPDRSRTLPAAARKPQHAAPAHNPRQCAPFLHTLNHRG